MRLLGLLFSVLAAIATAVITWPQFFRVERMFPFAQLVSVRGIVAIALIVVALLALLLSLSKKLRGFAASIAIIAILGAGVNAAIVFQRGIDPEGSLPERTADSVRVMTWNTAGDATPAKTIAETAVAMDADIVSLPETFESVGETVAKEMRDHGKPMWVHHVNFNKSVANGPAAWETTILISPTLGSYSVIESNEDGGNNTGTVPSVVAMPVDGNGPTVVAVHAVAPRPSAMGDWESDLRWVADQCGAPNTILAGDFNATLDHMAGLGVNDGTMGRCVDAASHTGSGGVGTWPTDLPNLLGAPIDHVMSTNDWTATGSVVLRSFDKSGSDHRPLIVQLERSK